MPHTSPSPFLLFPWNRPFLPQLKKYLDSLDGESILIVPNNRPWRYLQELYKKDGHVAILPKMYAIDDVVQSWCGRLHRGRVATLLDCEALLYQCVQELAQQDPLLQTWFGSMDLPHFLPWGRHLAKLADDMLRHMVDAQDMRYMEGEVSAPAAALLGSLGKICASFRQALARNNMTTQGLEYALAGEQAKNIPTLLQPGRYRHVVIAGFFQLDAAEEKLLHALWQTGAHVCLHTDPALASGADVHWACMPHSFWLERWKARTEVYACDNPPYTGQMRFFEGYDCHSQLAALREDLSRQKEASASTAIILSDHNLLLPTLNHLPQTDVNVSMGYPLIRSQLAQFLCSVMEMHTHALPHEGFFWRDIVHCLQHPSLLLLGNFQTCLVELVAKLRSKSRFVNTETVLALLRGGNTRQGTDFLETVLGLLLRKTPPLVTCQQMAAWLGDIVELFRNSEASILEKTPLEAEALLRIRHNVLPALGDNLLAKREFPFAVVQSITNECLEQERVPFEADPIAGLQVIGLLESRLLQFDHIYFLDATDDKLPGSSAQDPLLPDALRALAGLPDSHRQELSTAYNVHRLVACAKKVHVYWQEGISHSALFDAKKVRSRFVEQWIWEEELRNKAILERGKPPLRTAQCQMHPLPSGEPCLKKTPALHLSLEKLLQGPVSATMLNTYIQCPLQFARQYLLRLGIPEEITDGDDPAAAGTCLHSVLQELHSPFVGKTLSSKCITPSDIKHALARAMQNEQVRNLPADSFLVLEIMAQRKLATFIEQQDRLPSPPLILALEKKCQRTFAANGKSYILKGFVDRLDQRDGQTCILDYKTGNIHLPKTSLWTEDEFFADVAALTQSPLQPGQGGNDELFSFLAEQAPNIQLPLYVTLLAEHTPPVGNACLVALKTDCREHALFKDLEDDALARARTFCGLTVALVLREMESCTAFGPDTTGKACEWCPYAGLCSL